MGAFVVRCLVNIFVGFSVATIGCFVGSDDTGFFVGTNNTGCFVGFFVRNKVTACFVGWLLDYRLIQSVQLTAQE